MEVKVAKFGGSSLADAGQFKKVADIVKADDKRKFIVASAPGKREKGDIKVTDMLYECYDKAVNDEPFEDLLAQIKERYDGIISELGIDIELDADFDKIKASFSNMAGRDYAASRGEYLNSKILAAYLGYQFLDAAKYIFFDDAGKYDWDKTRSKLRPKLEESENAVIPGFYGSMPNGTIKTFSRGGSDITGSIVARAAQAELYENWTDVSGFLIADPRVVKDSEPIKTITYAELRELAYMGASVLHEDAIFPVRSAGIPINIKNTNRPQDHGTMIVSETAEKPEHIITGIAGKKGMSVITIEKDKMNSTVGFGRNVLRSLEKNDVSFEHMPSGIDTMSVIIQTDALTGKETAILDEIHSRVHPDQLYIESDLALITIVGRGMKSTRGTAAILFKALADSRVNVKMIDQGSSELNIIIGVAEEDFEIAMRAIYDAFIQISK